MIAALARHRVIGTRRGGIPWDLPRDSRHFRTYTAGHPLLLGRRTFQEMAGWFTTQTPLVMTRRPARVPGDVCVVGSVEEAVQRAEAAGARELVVGGGASIYAQALPYADVLVLTRIDLDCAGTVKFPDFEATGAWTLKETSRFEADAENAHGMTFQLWERVGRSPGGEGRA